MHVHYTNKWCDLGCWVFTRSVWNLQNTHGNFNKEKKDYFPSKEWFKIFYGISNISALNLRIVNTLVENWTTQFISSNSYVDKNKCSKCFLMQAANTNLKPILSHNEWLQIKHAKDQIMSECIYENSHWFFKIPPKKFDRFLPWKVL